MRRMRVESKSNRTGILDVTITELCTQEFERTNGRPFRLTHGLSENNDRFRDLERGRP